MGGYLTIRNDKMLLPSEGNCHMFFLKHILRLDNKIMCWTSGNWKNDAIILFGKNILVCETMMHDMREQNNTSLIHKICPCCIWSCNSSVQRNVVPKSTDVHHLFSVLCVALPLCRDWCRFGFGGGTPQCFGRTPPCSAAGSGTSAFGGGIKVPALPHLGKCDSWTNILIHVPCPKKW